MKAGRRRERVLVLRRVNHDSKEREIIKGLE